MYWATQIRVSIWNYLKAVGLTVLPYIQLQLSPAHLNVGDLNPHYTVLAGMVFTCIVTLGNQQRALVFKGINPHHLLRAKAPPDTAPVQIHQLTRVREGGCAIRSVSVAV